jgi:hypothetical protein
MVVATVYNIDGQINVESSTDSRTLPQTFIAHFDQKKLGYLNFLLRLL